MLDKYKISKTFFVRTDQADCASLEAPPSPPPPPQLTEQKSKTKPKPQAAKPDGDTRSAVGLKTEANGQAGAEISEQKASADIPKTMAEGSAKLEKVETVPERILKTAELIKEGGDGADETVVAEIEEKNVAEGVKEGRSANRKETVSRKK